MGDGTRRVTEEDALRPRRLPVDRTDLYGSHPLQSGDLRVPPGPGPHPVVVLLHGGCWRAIADRGYVEPLAVVLREAGWATWNVDYRTVDHPGGGWPGTFRDVGAAVDHLRSLADHHELDLTRVVTAGHSAGGHLAAWAAGRARVPPGSEVAAEDPQPVRGVAAFAGILDLADFDGRKGRGCRGAVKQLLDAPPSEAGARLGAACPSRLLPLGVPQLLVAGDADPVVPVAHVGVYAAAAREAGDPVELAVVPDAGHFEVVAPWWAGWAAVEERLVRFLVRCAPPAPGGARA